MCVGYNGVIPKTVTTCLGTKHFNHTEVYVPSAKSKSSKISITG